MKTQNVILKSNIDTQREKIKFLIDDLSKILNNLRDRETIASLDQKQFAQTKTRFVYTRRFHVLTKKQ